MLPLLSVVCFMIGFIESAQANDSRPIYLNNVLPIMQGSGLTAPKASLLSDDEKNSDWSVLVSANLQSHANEADSGDEYLIIDGEVQQLSLLTQWNFTARWQLGVDLSLTKNSAGNFDNAIREWHDLFSLDQGDRKNLPDDQFLVNYRDGDISSIELSDSASSLSDTEVSLAYQLYADNGLSVAAHLSAMLPTGDADKATGSDKTDIKLSLAVGSNTNTSLAWHLNADVIAIGDDALFAIPTKDTTWAVSAGLHWKSNEDWRWSMQLDGHGEIFISEIDEINQPVWQLSLAGQYKRWQVYFAEDLTVNRAADFSFGVNWLSAY